MDHPGQGITDDMRAVRQHESHALLTGRMHGNTQHLAVTQRRNKTSGTL